MSATMKTQLNSTLRKLIPTNVKDVVKRSRLWLRYKSSCSNIYHCCVHKTASQWIQSLFFDSRIYRYSGLTVCPNGKVHRGGYETREANNAIDSDPFPEKTIAGSLHISFDNFLAIPKPKCYKAFFVMRDPRDIVVSYYFSAKYSHVLDPRISKEREILNSLSQIDGMVYTIESLNKFGLFTALESWIGTPIKDLNIKIFRFEDLTNPNNFAAFKQLFSHCDIVMPDKILSQFLKDYTFQRLTKGRPLGDEDRRSHLRKGVPGDWQNYFNEKIDQEFKKVTGDLVSRLGYEKSI